MTSLAFSTQGTQHTHHFTESPTSKMKMRLGQRPVMVKVKGYNVIFKHIKCNPSFQYCYKKSYHTTHLIKQIEITINNKGNVTYARNESCEAPGDCPQVCTNCTSCKYLQMSGHHPSPPSATPTPIFGWGWLCPQKASLNSSKGRVSTRLCSVG